MHFTYLIKELARRKGRTITNVLGVTVLVAILVILTSVINAYSTAIYMPFKNVGADLIVQKSGIQATDTPTSAIRLPFGKGLFVQNEISTISTISHVEDISKALVLWQFDKGSFISIEGLEPGSSIGQKMSSWTTSGRFLTVSDGNKIVVEKHFAKFYGVKLGDSMKLGNTNFEIVGLLTAQDASQVSSTNIYMNLNDAQQLLGTTGYSQLYIRMDALSSEDAVRTAISQVDTSAVVISGNSIAASLGNVVKIYDRFQILGSAILAIIVAFILFQVNATGLLERKRDIGIMQTVGWTRKNIGAQIVSEVFLQTILGCLLGIALSFIILSTIGSIGIQTNLPGNLANDISTLTAPLEVSYPAVGQFSLLALIISTVVSLFLVRRVSGMKPLTNLKSL
jgi:putative ABC transport system permease protein